MLKPSILTYPEERYIPLSSIKILYIEDYDLVLFTVKQLLELEGWLVEICRDGVAALKKLESEEHYDLIISDAELPGMRGLELLRRIRELTHRRRTPILMFTASDCQPESMIAGADVFLKKPSGIRDLIRTIKQLLEDYQSVSDPSEESVNRNSIKRFPSRA